jgi:hypothetical protein
LSEWDYGRLEAFLEAICRHANEGLEAVHQGSVGDIPRQALETACERVCREAKAIKGLLERERNNKAR